MNAYPNANPAPRKNGNKKLIRAGVIAAVAIVLALIVYGGCTAIVPTGYTGILTTFGKVADYTLDAGFHLKSPFQVVTVMDNREQKTSYNTQAFSSDIQQVQVIGSINYNINKNNILILNVANDSDILHYIGFGTYLMAEHKRHIEIFGIGVCPLGTAYVRRSYDHVFEIKTLNIRNEY